MNEYFTIGEISKFFNIDVRLLRHYDKISLLKPEYVNEENGYCNGNYTEICTGILGAGI